MSGIDCAWRTRVTSFYSGAEAAVIFARARCVAPAIQTERAAALEAMGKETAEKRRDACARPFRFEDLNGKPEPSSWGPIYPKTASAAVEKWRMTARGRELSADEKRAYGQAVGAWIRGLNDIKPAPRVSLKYTMPDYAAKCRAEFAAKAEADKRAWALGKAKNGRGETIAQAYARAMAEKAERLANPEAYARKLEAEAYCARQAEEARAKAARKAAKAYRPRKAAKQREAA
jgi:hypothetical protein